MEMAIAEITKDADMFSVTACWVTTLLLVLDVGAGG